MNPVVPKCRCLAGPLIHGNRFFCSPSFVLFFVFFVSFVVSPPAAAAPERPAAAGTYVDSGGGRHAWRVTPGHAMMWEEKPYLPTGVLFQAASLREAGDAAWEEDLRALDGFKAAGALDLIVRADRGLTAAPAGALARLVDALQERGFRYGLEIADRPAAPPMGYWLRPVTIDVPAAQVAPGATSRWSVPIPVPGAESALYALVDTRDGSGLRAGQVAVTEGRAEIEVHFRPARRMFLPGPAQLLVLPIRRLEADPATPDLWASLPAYRERLLGALKEARWGPGLRFFLDPLVVDAGLRGEVEDLLPSSEAFRVEFEAWLQRRGSAGDTSVAWGLNDRRLESLKVAARLVPVWRRDENAPGAGWFVDPETLDLYRADRRRSRFWTDLERFRADSTRQAMNVMADLLKQRIAEVPVLYRWTQLHPTYTNRETVDGWDGLVARDEGAKVASSAAHSLATALAYAQCEASARTLWYLATGTAARPETAAALREIGARAYYVEGRSLPEALPALRPLLSERVETVPMATDGRRATSNRSNQEPGSPAPRSGGRAGGARSQKPVPGDEKPAVIFYPVSMTVSGQGADRGPGIGVTRLANGVWWLPAFAAGRSLILGEGLEGYHIDTPFGEQPGPTTCVWSTAGKRKATFVVPRELTVAVYDSLGRPVKAKPRKGRLQLELTELPYILTGLQGEMVFPVEAAAHALEELEGLIRMAEARRLNPNVLTALKAALADARAVFTQQTAATAFDLIRGPLESLRNFLSPYLWIEGERPREHTFSGIAAEPGASQGACLALSTARDPAGGAYVARYPVTVNAAGRYDLWLAGSVPGQEGASPLHWEIVRAEGGSTGAAAGAGSPSPSREGGRGGGAAAPIELLPPSAARTPGGTASASYAPGLSWNHLGAVRLDPGKYLLSLSVAERGAERYLFRVDTLLFAREPFTPDGVRKPVWRLAGKR